MARSHLWDVGLDYEHDTSFGIGSYQNLHRIPEVIGQQMFITIGRRHDNRIAAIVCEKTRTQVQLIFTADKLSRSWLL